MTVLTGQTPNVAAELKQRIIAATEKESGL